MSNPDTWKQQWEAFMNAPYIMFPLLLFVAGAVWWFRGKMSEATVAGLREQINGLREQINIFNARLQLAAEKASLADEAKDELERQFQTYKAEVAAKAGNGAFDARIAKVEASIEKLAAANNAVRSAIGVAAGVFTVTGSNDSFANTPLAMRVQAEADKER
ncbi:MAG TPA: hypothetical protein VIL70_06425 [Chthoniobacterales bacterium]